MTQDRDQYRKWINGLRENPTEEVEEGLIRWKNKLSAKRNRTCDKNSNNKHFFIFVFSFLLNTVILLRTLFYTKTPKLVPRQSCDVRNIHYISIKILLVLVSLSLVQWLACLTTDHAVAGSIPGTSTNFKCGLGLERGQPSLVRTIGQLLD